VDCSHLPVLFAAGMALVDATDNTLMLGAYEWAFVKPVRKFYYNLTITSAPVVVALIIGGIEMLGLAGEHFHLQSKIRTGDQQQLRRARVPRRGCFYLELDRLRRCLQVAAV
jgi:HoxN/HupN/NixA family high-affinity nickel-transporter